MNKENGLWVIGYGLWEKNNSLLPMTYHLLSFHCRIWIAPKGHKKLKKACFFNKLTDLALS